MSVRRFEQLVKTEISARRHLVGLCWPGGKKFCPRCQGTEVYKYKGTRLRCKSCRYDFHHFTGRWINHLRISCRGWLWIVKLFELELSTRKISQQVEKSYPTTLKATTILRRAILAAQDGDPDLLRGEVEMDEAYFGGRRKGKRGRGAAGKVPVFGILERNGQVTVEVVEDVTAETLLNETIKKSAPGLDRIY
jgi:transposase